MKKLSFLCLIITLFSGCMTKEKLISIIDPELKNYPVSNVNTLDSMIFDFSKLKSMNERVICGKQTTSFLPLILYWEWERSIKCELNQNIVGNMFKDAFIQSSAVSLNEKIKGKRLEIRIENTPYSFIYTDRGFLVFLVLFYMVGDDEFITPMKQDLTVSYRLFEHGQVIKEGTARSSNEPQPHRRPLKSSKKLNKTYVQQFKQNLNDLTKKVVDQISVEL